MTSAAVLFPNVTASQDHTYSESPTFRMHSSQFGRFAKFGRQSKLVAFSGKPVPSASCTAELTGHNADLVGSIWTEAIFPGIRHRLEPKRSSDLGFAEGPGFSPYDSTSSYADGSMLDTGAPMAPMDGPKPWAMYTNSVMHALHKETGIEMAGTSVITSSGRIYDVYDSIYKHAAQSDDDVGRFPDTPEGKTARWLASQTTNTYVQRHRVWTDHNTHRLPTAAISWTKVRFRTTFESLERLYDTSDNSVPFLVDQDRELTSEHIKVNLYVDLYWLTEAERELIQKLEHNYIIEQDVHLQDIVDPKKSYSGPAVHKFKLDLLHPVKELLFAYQSNRQLKEKNWFAYDKIAEADLTINNASLHSMRGTSMLQIAELERFHGKKPTKNIYGFVFCEEVENFVNLTGYMNPSSFKDVSLNIKLPADAESGVLHVFAKSVNVLMVHNKYCRTIWMAAS